MMWFDRRLSWRKAIRNLSKNYSKSQRFRTVSVSVAIWVVIVLFTSLLTLYVGVELSVGRYEIEHYGTEAHGEVFNVSKGAYEALKADEGIRDTAYSRMVGVLSSEAEDSKRYYLYYDEPKAMEWEGTRIIGEYPKGDHDIVVSERLLQLYGLEEKVNQTVRLSYTTMGEKHTESFHIVGYYPSRQVVVSEGDFDGNHYPGTYEKLYISQGFCGDKLSNYSEKQIETYFDANKTNGDGLYQVQIRFPHKYDISGQAQRLVEKYKEYFSAVYLNSGWLRIDPMGRAAANFPLILLAALVIGLVGVFVINSLFQIPIMEDARFWGLLQTLGVSCRQYRFFLFLQMQTYAVYGILLGGLTGYVVGYVLLPLIINNFYQGAVARYMPFQLWIPCVCMTAGFLISYLCCFRVARMVADLSPVEMERLREESIGTKRRKRLYVGAYKSHYFAWKKVKVSKSKTRAVTAVFLFLLLLVMMAATFLRSINASYYVQGRLGGLDFVVLSKNATKGETLQECASALDTLQESCGLAGLRIGKSERELALYDNSTAQEQKEIFHVENVEEYLLEHDLFDSSLPEHSAYLSVFGFDSRIVQQMDVIEGEIDTDKYRSGNYVILTTSPLCPEGGAGMGGTEDCKNPLYALYGVGDEIEIYGKKYEVMAVAAMPSVLCSYSLSNELPVIMPYMEAAARTDAFCTYGAVYQAADFGDAAEERLINHILTDQGEVLEYVSRDTVEAQLNALSKMMYVICLLMLLFIVVILMIHAINISAFSIQNEKHVFAALQSIGMQRRQQIRQICWENIFQICISFVLAMIVGSIFSVTVVRNLCSATAICVYHYSFMPVVAASILLSAGMSVSAVGSYNGIWKKYHMIDLLNEK